MNVLTLWDPWAWAMAWALKPVENRTWEPPRRAIGQLLAIHAGKTLDRQAIEDIALEFGVAPEAVLGDFLDLEEKAAAECVELRRVGRLVPSAVVCVGTLAGFVRDDGTGFIHPNIVVPDKDGTPIPHDQILAIARASGWYNGPVGWIVVNRVALPRPVPCRGAQGLWTLPPEVEAEVRRQLGEVVRG